MEYWRYYGFAKNDKVNDEAIRKKNGSKKEAIQYIAKKY